MSNSIIDGMYKTDICITDAEWKAIILVGKLKYRNAKCLEQIDKLLKNKNNTKYQDEWLIKKKQILLKYEFYYIKRDIVDIDYRITNHLERPNDIEYEFKHAKSRNVANTQAGS